MDQHRRAAPLVTFTIVFLAIYVPLETLYSLPALWDPFYLVDFIGMALLVWGVQRCRHEASAGSLSILVAGYAWEGANFWRALFGRVEEILTGGALRFGLAELCFVACGTVVVLAALAWSLRLATTAPSAGVQPQAL
jgi:hypothetical protein